jgi:hypothetical protein
LLTLTLAACRGPLSAATDGLEVAPQFASFWSRGGGLATYGPPISPPRREAGRLHQTFLAVELILEESSSGEAVRLAPLGWELGLAEPPIAPIDGQVDAYDPETGHSLYAGFASLYERLGGKEVVGAPITEVIFRDGQIAQYFENLGLYRPENASPADTRLIALGLTSRPPADSFGLDTEAFVLSGLIRQRPFASFLEPYGGEGLFGQPLTNPYFAEDGALEQVYERAVVYSPDGSARKAALRPLGSWIGTAGEPAPPSAEPGATYFEETGHNVQWAFADFYEANDGGSLLGLPLEEAVLESDRMTQRFENGVLTYRFDLPPELAVQLAPLGRSYLAARPIPTAESQGPAVVPVPAIEGAPQALRLEAALGQTILAPGKEQNLTVRVTRPDGSPVADTTVVLRIIGRQREREIPLPATDQDGRTAWTWRDPGPAPGEIVNVLLTGTEGGARGSALVQYAYGFRSSP